MTITPAVRVADRKLVVKDRAVITNMPENIIAASGSDSGSVDGLFLGAVFDEKSSRHVVPLGTFLDLRFFASFRFKLWWMCQRMGERGRDVPVETQFLLVEVKTGSAGEDYVYAVFLPLIEGKFRACLQGNSNDELELCLESGDVDTVGSEFTHSVYIHVGSDPFTAISDAVTAVKLHLKSFRQRHEKKLPGIMDYFGWCTWDAFYQEVTQEGVEAGLKSLSGSATPPKFVLIDDGWQSVGGDPETEKSVMRLTGIKENSKFQKNTGIQDIVNTAKEKYGLKHAYVWHAITGYWGGVRPGVKEMEEYGPATLKYPNISKGVMENEPTWKSDPIAVQGLGVVNPKNAQKFFNEMHGYLASAGVDGVKVDVQCILETLGGGVGGRVEITRQYNQALDASIAKNFPDNGIIACMSHNTDALYCSKQTGVVRASDDFFPRDPVSHTIHIAAVAYNSVFLGEFMQPDWDMFHSLHPAAEYHGSARAISGGPVYVSDAPGKHNFDLLKKLVFPDGSILRACLPGRPTKDCLFSDPARDGISLLKIWNMNKYTGVIGVYNCQGAAWNAVEKKNTFHQTNPEAITGHVRARDVHLISEAALDSHWDGNCAVYSHRSGELIALPHDGALPVSLKVLEHEVFTVTPVKDLAPGFSFAPLGLLDMFNAGGAIVGLEYEEVGLVVSMEVKGCGRFGAFSSAKPRTCKVGGNVTDFSYDWDTNLVTLTLHDLPAQGQEVHHVIIEL
ncbi:PREDICTED: probable galactinol--sucrose galactosyltransferase 6 [Ipomoea nil]|uniref:probable galactinol--sucrose galactosyltransferase 6 n=1 Tax=Ipomoea nil TaxID=35883 RepID=UPI00090178F8|nr:PREDICTED: probable galactinol--sucrose galactosyltransferase 6 [Ipomoea nil]XP_019150496.1 PREDICTED: probable galactinol--sucrose galactosyltransferase 6 [Ipomoea nil]